MVVDMRRTDLQRTITIAEAARKVGITPNGLRHWIAKGEIDTITTPLGRIVVEVALDEFLQRRREKKEEEHD